jgi:hypothetical protein
LTVRGVDETRLAHALLEVLTWEIVYISVGIPRSDGDRIVGFIPL